MEKLVIIYLERIHLIINDYTRSSSKRTHCFMNGYISFIFKRTHYIMNGYTFLSSKRYTYHECFFFFFFFKIIQKGEYIDLHTQKAHQANKVWYGWFMSISWKQLANERQMKAVVSYHKPSIIYYLL